MQNKWISVHAYKYTRFNIKHCILTEKIQIHKSKGLLRIRELLLTDNDFPNECFARVSFHASFTVNRELRTFKTKWIYSIIFQFPSIGLCKFSKFSKFLSPAKWIRAFRSIYANKKQWNLTLNYIYTFNNTLLIFLNFENN